MAQWFELPDLPIRVTEYGAWLHGDEPLHPRVALLFAQHVVPTADGQYFVQLGMARQRLEVADTPYWVRQLHEHEAADGSLAGVTLWLSDGAVESLDPATLVQRDDHVLYCRIVRHGLTVRCRFTPAQYHGLALRMEAGEDGDYYLPLAGQRWPIATGAAARR